VKRHVFAALIVVLASPVFGDSQLVLETPVSDADFYRAVACGAPPGQACAVDLVHWPRRAARDLGVRVMATQPGFSRLHGDAGLTALDRAISEINGTGAGLRLRRTAPRSAAPIEVWFSDLDQGDPIALPGMAFPKGDRMEGARVYIWWNEIKDIDRAVIILSRDLTPDEMGSVMLEELTQAMGFLTDLEGPAYAETSIFSETSNAITRLQGQDRMAIRRHYPPRN
jgi:Protein of unknown function (DUF2927)